MTSPSRRAASAIHFQALANGKLLDVWMLMCCELCGRTTKIPIHERIYVQALDSERLLMFENNDPAMVRDLAMDGALAGQGCIPVRLERHMGAGNRHAVLRTRA